MSISTYETPAYQKSTRWGCHGEAAWLECYPCMIPLQEYPAQQLLHQKPKNKNECNFSMFYTIESNHDILWSPSQWFRFIFARMSQMKYNKWWKPHYWRGPPYLSLITDKSRKEDINLQLSVELQHYNSLRTDSLTRSFNTKYIHGSK